MMINRDEGGMHKGLRYNLAIFVAIFVAIFTFFLGTRRLILSSLFYGNRWSIT